MTVTVKVVVAAGIAVTISKMGLQGSAGPDTAEQIFIAAGHASAAQTARTAAEGAATTSSTKASEAAGSATAADTARGLAEVARTGAETARTGAETAKTVAEAAQTTATTKAGEAAASATAASTAQTGAETARTGAETARTGAETARTLAETAKSDAQGSATAAAGSATTAGAAASTATTKASEAATSAGTATTKATEAAASAGAAAGSASTAGTHAGNAAGSAASAGASATVATTKAGEASDSATIASGAASTASTRATEANNSAAAASASATTASGAAGTATTKASEAAASAANAGTSAATASGAAGTATTKASEAAASATTASGAAGTATTKASEAAASATTASGAAGTATTKASEASASATAAAGSASTASSAADTATTKASEAAASATTASGAAGTATTKASEAATSAGAAATSVTAASTSQGAAAASAVTAQNSATAAAASATTAQTAASAAVEASGALSYQFSNSTVDADPGAAQLRLNNALMSLVTQIYVDLTDRLGNDVSAILDTIDDSTNPGSKAILRLFEPTTGKLAVYRVSVAVQAPIGYRRILVQYVGGSGGSFSNGQEVGLTWAQAGDQHEVTGPDTSVQFNDAGALMGDAALTFDKTTGRLSADSLYAGARGALAAGVAALTVYGSALDNSWGGAIDLKSFDGTARGAILSSSTAGLMFATGAARTQRWSMDLAAGHLAPSANDLTDVGTSTARVRQVMANGIALSRAGSAVYGYLTAASEVSNTLEVENGVNPTGLRIFNTRTSALNNERLNVAAQGASGYVIYSEAVGAGVVQNLNIGTQGAASLNFVTNSLTRWIMQTAGHVVANVDNAYDFGASGVNRPRSGYFGTSVVAPLLDLGNNVLLRADGAAILALRNASTAQRFFIYNTFTDSVNYERMTLGWTANEFLIQMGAAGTGVNTRVLTLSSLTYGWKSPVNGVMQAELVSGNTFRLYNLNDTTTTNYERAKFQWASSVLQIGAEAGGTGVLRDVALMGNNVHLQGGGVARWYVSATGVFQPFADNTYDIGVASTARLANIYAVNASVNTRLTMGAAAANTAMDITWGVGVGGGVQTFSQPLRLNPSGNVVQIGLAGSVLIDGSVGLLEQRNGAIPQIYRLHNNYSDAANYERGQLVWTGNTLYLRTESAGTGLSRPLVLGTMGASFLQFMTNGSIRWNIDNNGNLLPAIDNTVNIGNGSNRVGSVFALGSVSAATSVITPNVSFPAAQVASADPNTLDDYEEGTFTPTINFGGASVGITYAIQTGAYTKVGNRVFGSLRVGLTAKGTSVGTLAIGGLPFASNATANTHNVCAVWPSNLTGLATSPYSLIHPGGQMNIYHGASSANALTDANFTDTSGFIVSFSYFV